MNLVDLYVALGGTPEELERNAMRQLGDALTDAESMVEAFKNGATEWKVAGCSNLTFYKHSDGMLRTHPEQSTPPDHPSQ